MYSILFPLERKKNDTKVSSHQAFKKSVMAKCAWRSEFDQDAGPLLSLVGQIELKVIGHPGLLCAQVPVCKSSSDTASPLFAPVSFLSRVSLVKCAQIITRLPNWKVIRVRYGNFENDSMNITIYAGCFVVCWFVTGGDIVLRPTKYTPC